MASERTRKVDAGTQPSRPLLRRADQAVVAFFVAAALVGMGAYWVVQGGPRGELIEIDRATPLEAKFLVDINQAEWPELAELPDIGPTLAKRIVDTRQANGAYRDHEDLRRVRGIGPVTMERIKPYLLPMPVRSSVAGGEMTLILGICNGGNVACFWRFARTSRIMEGDMSTDSQTVIDGFDALPTLEQREVIAELLRKASQWESPPLADEDLVRLADERFLELDRREAQDGG